MRLKHTITLLAALTLTACGLGQEAKRPLRVYDFGLQPAANSTARQPGHGLAPAQVRAPNWLDTTAVSYRLAYHDAAQLHSYAESRWAAPPTALLALRLRQAQGEAPDAVHGYQWQVELEEFSQVFDTQHSARSVLRARVSLLRNGTHGVLASRTVNIERPSPSADAVGAVQALTATADALVAEMQAWQAAEMSKR